MSADAADFDLYTSARVAVNRVLFRALVFGGGAATAASWALGFPKETTWETAKAAGRNICNATGVAVHFRGLEHIESGGPFLFTPNHQSHIDICALLGFLPGHNLFAAKKELFDEPFLGQAMRVLGMVPIDRDDPTDSLALLNRSFEKGRSIIMFPEGTRSRGGEMLPFKKGAFVAAIETQRPIVPVVVKGSGRVMPKGAYLTVVPGNVEIVLKAPISTEGLGYDDRDALRDRVRAVIEDELERPLRVP